MNAFINKLYNYYAQSEALLTDNFDLLTASQLEKINTIKVNVTLLDNVRQCLLKKQYSNAKIIIKKLDRIEQEHMVQLTNAIDEIEKQDLPYDLNLGITNSSLTSIPNNSVNDDINLLKEKLNAIELNLKENSLLINKINETIITNESINQILDSNKHLASQLEIVNSSSPGIATLNEKVQSLLPTVEQIKNNFESHLQTVNADYLKVVVSYRDQTIETVNSMKKSTIDTAEMLMHDLPKQVTAITDIASSTVEKSISKTLWSNYILFVLGFFICVLISAWFMGERVGRTMQQELYQAVYNNYAASKDNPTPNTNKNKIHKN